MMRNRFLVERERIEINYGKAHHRINEFGEEWRQEGRSEKCRRACGKIENKRNGRKTKICEIEEVEGESIWKTLS